MAGSQYSSIKDIIQMTSTLKINSKGRFKSIHQFAIIEDSKIGCGSFGTVRLARHKSSCCIYAMKIIKLKDMPSETEVRLVERQIKIHSGLDHPHIAKLWDTLVEDEVIYMIMDYAENGNLFYYQNTKNVFSEAEAFKFFCQTLNGVKYLHDRDIVHRDLKPENLLLDSLNNIKICDFGWGAEDIKFKRTTFCGTYQYMAPEMLFQSEYDYRVDIWALGVLLFEMLHGSAPYKGKNVGEVQQEMLKGELKMAENISSSVRNLLEQILQFQPERRLSIGQIYEHPWLREMENGINAYLRQENTTKPKEIHSKITNMPIVIHSFRKKQRTHSVKHRKNNSLNFEEIGRNININLEINNFAFMKKKGRTNNYHSQQNGLKMIRIDYNEIKESFKISPTKLLKKTTDISHDTIIDKGKAGQRIFKEGKQRKNWQQVRGMQPLKKFKMRKSQADFQCDKLTRFNTEISDKNEWEMPLKLLKPQVGMLKGKTAMSRSNMKGRSNKLQ